MRHAGPNFAGLFDRGRRLAADERSHALCGQSVTPRNAPSTLVAGLALACCATVSPAAAGSTGFQTLHTFCSQKNCADGANLFGVTSSGASILEQPGKMATTSIAENSPLNLTPNSGGYNFSVLYMFCAFTIVRTAGAIHPRLIRPAIFTARRRAEAPMTAARSTSCHRAAAYGRKRFSTVLFAGKL